MNAAGMIRKSASRLTRRDLLRASVISGGALLVGFDMVVLLDPIQERAKDPFAGGRQLGILDFIGEARMPMETALGAELDGRLYTDLSALTPENPVTPTEKFYIRTRASALLEGQEPSPIRLGGLVRQPIHLSLGDLDRMVKPAGFHLMECAGNVRAAHFGMLSVADWAGVPVAEVLDIAKIAPEANRVLISGFDSYSTTSTSSVPGASWIFTLEELKSSRTFLATRMNGQPLTKDHGAPVRLVVPGWYGCTSIKWVNEITLVGDDVEATSQMQEYATRTLQSGVPKLAKDYKPASVDQAAAPIKVEKWLVHGKIIYRVIGILWGGSRPVSVLEIRFNPEEDYVPVDSFKHTANDPWSFWIHAWLPKKPGAYAIRLRVKDPAVQARRLDSGFYVRSVEVAEV